MELSVIIVNYKVPDYIHQCLLTIKKSAVNYNMEIFVVDNDSKDESVVFLKKLHPDVTFIENDENVGFSKANNIAIKRAKGEFLLIINPDTFVGESFFDDCVDFMRKNPGTGALGVKMHSPNGKFAPESKRAVPKPFTAFCKLVGLCKRFPKNKVFGRYYLGYQDEHQVNEIEVMSGACMFIRKSAIDKVGSFDEDFFMYGEDVDLSYRILKGGFKNYYIPTEIVHYKGESTQKVSYRYVNNFNKSMIIFFRKHFHLYSWMLEIPVLSAVYIKAALGYLKVWFYKVTGLMNYGNDNDKKTRFLVFTDDPEHDGSVRILEKNGFMVNTQEINDNIRESGHNSIDNISAAYDYVVYNPDLFDYKDIIRYFSMNEDKDKYVEMALYHSDIQKVITSYKIIS